MYQAFEQADRDAKTVLIVEDQIEMRAINAMYLHHHGYRVLATDNGMDGVRAAREEHPDLILMDISVPGLDGIRATETLKGDPDTVEIPVVLIGEAVRGTLVIHEHDKLAINAEALHLPDHVEVSIEGLEAGTHITAADVILPDGAELAADPKTSIAIISVAPSAEQMEGEGAGEVEAPVAEEEAEAPVAEEVSA